MVTIIGAGDKCQPLEQSSVCYKSSKILKVIKFFPPWITVAAGMTSFLRSRLLQSGQNQ
jgi:hypothetical protein